MTDFIERIAGILPGVLKHYDDKRKEAAREFKDAMSLFNKDETRSTGVNDLVRVGDLYHDRRRQIIDSFCAYLRRERVDDGSAESAVIAALKSRLNKSSWARDQDFDLDLRDATIGERFDLSGVRIRDFVCYNVKFDGVASFDNATFDGVASFDNAIFNRKTSEDDTIFDNATFNGVASFDNATFSHALFKGATFDGVASFDDADVEGGITFDNATFKGDAIFNEASLGGNVAVERITLNDATFSKTRFYGFASFYKAKFDNGASFDGATFKGGATFDRLDFDGKTTFHTKFHNVKFHNVKFHGDASFDNADDGATFKNVKFYDGATFNNACPPGTNLVMGKLTFNGTPFDGVTFNGGATFNNVTFNGGATFNNVTFNGGATFNNDQFDNKTVVERLCKDPMFKIPPTFEKIRYKNGAEGDK